MYWKLVPSRVCRPSKAHLTRYGSKRASCKKPSSYDKLLAARTVAFEKGDMATVEACDKIQEGRRATERAARARKKVRKSELAQYVARVHGPGNTNSDNE